MRGRTLVSIEHGRGVAAVVREERRGVWLVDDAGDGAGVTDHQPAVVGLEADVTLTGGLLPAGAVRAIVRDRAGREREATCGAEAWLALLREPIRGVSPIVRFLDAAGELVAAALPAGVELAPVEDADEPCPACRATEWGRVVVAPEGRYGRDGSGRPTDAVCRRCGHEESLPAVYTWACDDRVEDPDLIAALEERAARDRAATARTAPFTLFGLPGHRPTVAGHGSQDDDVDSVTLEFATAAGRVTVETSADEPLDDPGWMARELLEGELHDGDGDGAWPDSSATAVALWLNARSRAHAAVAAAAPVRELALPVAGNPTAFATVAHDDRFAAVARLPGAITIAITGLGDPARLALEPIAPATL